MENEQPINLAWAFVNAVSHFESLGGEGHNIDMAALTDAADQVLLVGQKVPLENLNSIETDIVLSDINNTRQFMKLLGVEMLETPRTDNAGGLTFKPSV